MGREGGQLNSHIPYLARLKDTHGGEDSDPSDPHQHLPKALWCFEPLNRRSCTTIEWEHGVRVRHVPSGRYLAVDTTSPLQQLHGGTYETWFAARLVDDEALEDDPTDMAETIGFDTISKESMIFYASPADSDMGKHISKEGVNMRLSHIFDDGTSKITLYLHATNDRKPPLAGWQKDLHSSDEHHHHHLIAHSLLLCFSTMRSAQDIYKLAVAPEAEQYAVRTAKEYVPHILSYSMSLADPTKPVRVEAAVEFVSQIVKLCKFLILGHVDLHTDDIMKKALDMENGALGRLFAGEPNPATQKACRDLKVIDAVFEASKAPYDRYASPWEAESPEAKAFRAFQVAQKFVHVCLRRLCADSRENENYFGRRHIIPLDGSKPPSSRADFQPISYMNALLDQVQDILGAAQTLTSFLDFNEDLVEKYTSASLVKRFLEMIEDLGPQPRLLQFYEAICSI